MIHLWLNSLTRLQATYTVEYNGQLVRVQTRRYRRRERLTGLRKAIEKATGLQAHQIALIDNRRVSGHWVSTWAVLEMLKG